MKPEKPPRVFSQPKTSEIIPQEESKKQSSSIKPASTPQAWSQAPNSSETCDSIQTEPPSRTSPCLE